ncbi:FCD domain-containing protein [Jiella pelagia]|uniref:FCD domain-containing protein n=1 Tax=Jiella pelagia TaxID=2986949 RepID=A0ABY7BW52_9HYPH|nr:FCD domain-containing protein [Jiella pelagia]WAP68062.1 FCD domain-containing protein [Jiella pelagia]
MTPQLAACGARMRTMAQDPSAFTAAEIDDAGTEFHELLMVAAGNAALQESVRLLRLRFRLAFHLPRYFSDEAVYSTLADHIAIFAAIEQRAARDARKLMRAHLKRGLAIRLKMKAASSTAIRSTKQDGNTTGMEITE